MNQTMQLVEAAAQGMTDRVIDIIDSGVSPNAQTYAGVTALMSACQNGRTKTVKALLDRGAQPNPVDEEGRTPLMLPFPEGTSKWRHCSWTTKLR